MEFDRQDDKAQSAPRKSAAPAKKTDKPKRGAAPTSSFADHPGFTAANIESIAEQGIQGTPQRLPQVDLLEGSFGRSLADIPAFVGGPAGRAADQLDAHGYTYKGAVALGDNPALHTVAEETAHALQQRSTAGQSSSTTKLASEHGASEREAKNAALNVVSGNHVQAPVSPLAPSTVARQNKCQTPENISKSKGTFDRRKTGVLKRFDDLPSLKYTDPKTKEEGTGPTEDYVSKIWDVGLKAGQNAKSTNRGKDEKKRERQIVIAVMKAVRNHLKNINSVDAKHHVGCMRSTELILGICKQLGVKGESYISKSGHTLPYFSKSDVGLKHGDDLVSKDLKELETKDLLLNKEQINQHQNKSDENDARVRPLVLSDASRITVSNTVTQKLAGIRASATVILRKTTQTAKAPPFDYDRANVTIQDIFGHSSFKKGLVKDANGKLSAKPQQIVSAFKVAVKAISQAGYGYAKGRFATTRDEALQLLATKMNQELVGHFRHPNSPSGIMKKNLRKKLNEETYPKQCMP